MGTLSTQQAESEDMDDSGCIQDETPPGKRGVLEVQLLDLSDDVLLMILKYLTPRDLKAVGYCCPRLGALILDRSLWQNVDARGQPWGRARLRWYLARALHAGTRELLVAGYAREARECLGYINQTREEVESARARKGGKSKRRENNNRRRNRDRFIAQRVIEVPALGPNAQLRIDDRQRPESPEAFAWPRPSDPLISDSTCPGPQFTLTHHTLRQLTDTCPALTSLALEYCNINCNCTNITMFPPTLTKLSLRGSKCYNLPLDRSFLFKIQDALPDLESLDVSECEWMEPASLLPLSKLLALKHLYARDCLRLTEFVAYASLATRYGFNKLQSLDLRGSPVGDSEVSALGWLVKLSHLWLSPARSSPPPAQHSHHKKDCLPSPATEPGDRWEEQEPEYYKLKMPEDDTPDSPETYSDESTHTWQAKLNGSSDYTGPTALSSSTISSPTMIINASPRRPGSGQPSSRRPKSSSRRTMIINAAPMRPGSSNDRAGCSNDIAGCSNDRAGCSNDKAGCSNDIAGCSNDSPTSPGPSDDSQATNSGSIQFINASPMRRGCSDNPRSSTSCLAMTPKVCIIRTNTGPGTCRNILIPRHRYTSSNRKAPKRKAASPKPGPSKRNRDDDDDVDDSSSSDDDVPLKCLIKKNNEGASTSKESEENESEENESQENDSEDSEEEGSEEEESGEENNVQVNVQQDEEGTPRHHVLYVNVGQRLHAVYRLSINDQQVVNFDRNSPGDRLDSRNIFISPSSHLDASSLVTDSAIRRFGRADGEDINYVHIGPNGPYPGAQVPGARPDRAALTHLSVTGFRTITDRSLEHLVTSAPHLQSLDLSETNVTDAGVAAFRSLRPECEVVYSKYEN